MTVEEELFCFADGVRRTGGSDGEVPGELAVLDPESFRSHFGADRSVRKCGYCYGVDEVSTELILMLNFLTKHPHANFVL